jgi:hypothetical protein
VPRNNDGGDRPGKGDGKDGGRGHGKDDKGDHDGKHGGKDKDKDGHGGRDQGGKVGKDKDCEDDLTDDELVTWIIDNPNVNTEFCLDNSVNDGSCLVDLVDSGRIPTSNTTAPLLNGTLPATLFNATNPGTSYGGLNVNGTNSTHTPLQGTNQNADTFSGGIRAFSLQLNLTGSTTDWNALRVSPGAQPEVPLPNPEPSLRCEYAYEHVLGGAGTTSKGALWALEGYVDLVAADVKQGGIGDCGAGAAIMALAAGGWTQYIKQMFVKSFSGDTRNIVAVFRKDGTTYPTLIDDQLPVLQNANPNCWPYPGYQPVNDAADPGPDGSYPPTPIFFMPLFEKALAKFLDFATDWRVTPAGYTGYAGLEGVPPHYVLAAVTGGTPKAVYRTKDGFDGPILAALITCMRGVAPCVIGTTNAVTLDGLGTEVDGSIWLNPAGDASVPRGYTPGQTSGLLASDSPASEHTYSIVDFDQLIDMPQGQRSTALTMVGNHAYAFAWQRSTQPPWQSPMVDWRMRFLNPWGNNPSQWPGGGGAGRGAWDDPSEITYSFRTFAQTVGGVYTIENMPPLTS